jgi:hypothetical protein
MRYGADFAPFARQTPPPVTPEFRAGFAEASAKGPVPPPDPRLLILIELHHHRRRK